MATPKFDRWLEEVCGLNLYPEQKARHIGETAELLEELLRDTATLYTKPWRDIFKGAKFDFSGKRLIAKDKTHILIWTLREFPDKPVTVNNQQTNRGYVGLYRILELYGRG